MNARRMPARPALAAIALACALSACSFMGLDEFELAPCRVPGAQRSVCDDLNAELPEGHCEEYVCRASGYGCEPKPRDRDEDGFADPVACKERDDLGALDCDDDDARRNGGADETCDGIDNDCDDWIDEDTKSDEAAAPPVDDDLGELEHLSVSEAGDDRFHAALTFRREAEYRTELWTLVGETRTGVDAATGGDCTFADGRPSRCNFKRVAIGAAPRALFAAGINYAGCGAGQLRVSGSASGDPSLARLAETADGSSFQVDIESEMGCTASTPCPGVSEPVVAALPELGSEPAQALVVWNAPREARTCPEWCAEGCDNGGPVSIAALGVRLDGSLAAAGDRTSELLAEAEAGGAAAVAAWPGPGAEGGYFVAFASSQQLELRFVPRLRGADSSLRDGLVEGRIAASAPSHLALALDRSAREAPRGLGVAYRTKDGDRSAIAFVPLDFDRAAAPAFSASSAVIQFETTEPITSGPALAYARDGFLQSEDASKTGGWLVTWIEGPEAGPQRLMAARIARTETHRLGPPVELARGTLSWLFAYVNQVIDGRDVLAYGFVDDAELRVGQFTCNPVQ